MTLIGSEQTTGSRVVMICFLPGQAAPGKQRPAGNIDLVIAVAVVPEQIASGENRQNVLEAHDIQQHGQRKAPQIGVFFVLRKHGVGREFFPLVQQSSHPFLSSPELYDQ